MENIQKENTNKSNTVPLLLFLLCKCTSGQAAGRASGNPVGTSPEYGQKLARFIALIFNIDLKEVKDFLFPWGTKASVNPFFLGHH